MQPSQESRSQKGESDEIKDTEKSLIEDEKADKKSETSNEGKSQQPSNGSREKPEPNNIARQPSKSALDQLGESDRIKKADLRINAEEEGLDFASEEFSPQKVNQNSKAKMGRFGTFLGVGRSKQSSTPLGSDLRQSQYMQSQDSQLERKQEIEHELEELRNMIHPNEWNNIPACVRSAIMGLVDFNDKITQKVVTEHSILASRISSLNELTIRQKSALQMQINEVSGKIDREVQKVMRKNERQTTFLEQQYSQLHQAQFTIDNQVTTMTNSMEDWQKKIHKLDKRIHETDKIAERVQKQGMENMQALNELVSRIQSQFLISGIIGPAETDLYQSIASCVSDLATFKHSAEKSFSKMCDTKIQQRLVEVFQKIDDETEETMELMRVQEQTINNARDKIEDLEDNVEQLQKKTGLYRTQSQGRARLDTGHSKRSGRSQVSRSNSQASVSNAGGSSSDNQAKKKKGKARMPSESKSSSSGTGSSSHSSVSRQPTRDMEPDFQQAAKTNPQIVIDQDETPRNKKEMKQISFNLQKSFNEDDQMDKGSLSKRDQAQKKPSNQKVEDSNSLSPVRKRIEKRLSSRQNVLQSQQETSKETLQPSYETKLLQQRVDSQDQKMKFFEHKQQKLIQHLLKYEGTVQKRIDAVNQLLLMAMSEDKKEESPIVIKNVEKVESTVLQDQNIRDILSNQENLEHELQNLISQKFAMEAELAEVRDQMKERKKVVIFKQEPSEIRTSSVGSSSGSESATISKSASHSKSHSKSRSKSKSKVSVLIEENVEKSASVKSESNPSKQASRPASPIQVETAQFSPGRARKSQPQIQQDSKVNLLEVEASDVRVTVMATASEGQSNPKPELTQNEQSQKEETIGHTVQPNTTPLENVKSSKTSDKTELSSAIPNIDKAQSRLSSKAKSPSIPDIPQIQYTDSHEDAKESRNQTSKLSKHTEQMLSGFSEQNRTQNQSPSKQSPSPVKICELCNGTTFGEPCHEAIQKLRTELLELINSLFEKRQAEFIHFIENDLEIENQINIKSDDVLKTFYKNHNTVNKMYDNFRLFEYKRKVYLDQKRDKSESPVRHSISTGSREIRERTAHEPLSPNKNFMTHLPATSHDVHASIDTTAQYLNEKMSSNRKRAARNANVFNITAPSLQGKGGRYSTSRFTSQQTIIGNDEEDKQFRRVAHKTNLINGTSAGQTNFSSGTTQRVNPQFQMVDKLPIISTRKAHLTVDQRVWDSDQSELTKLNISYPAELNEHFGPLSLDENIYPGSNQRIQQQSFDFGGKMVIKKAPKFIHQDSSKHNIAQSQTFSKHGKTPKARVQTLPLQVKFQELNPVKNIHSLVPSSNISPRTND